MNLKKKKKVFAVCIPSCICQLERQKGSAYIHLLHLPQFRTGTE